MTRVFFDARLAARGLGIASATERLVIGFQEVHGLQLNVNATSRGWTRSGQVDTALRSGLLDFNPSADPRTWTADVVHYFGNTAPRWGGRRSLITVHDLMMVNQQSRKARLFQELLLPGLRRGNAMVAAISNRTADAIHQVTGRELNGIEVVPHGRRARAMSTAPRSHILMFGGSSDPRKRVDLGLAAYRRYAEMTGAAALPLTIAGRSGVSPTHLQIVEKQSVTLTTDPTVHEVDNMLAEAACLIYPTKLEGFGLPLVEAGEVGTPVVIGQDADIPAEALGTHVVQVPTNSCDDWARSIREAVNMRGVPGAVDHLPTWPEVARRYNEMYSELVTR